MSVFIAKDYDGVPLDVVLATDKRSAQLYWQGKGVVAHHVESHEEADLKDHPTGVIPIVTTYIRQKYDIRDGAEVRCISKKHS